MARDALESYRLTADLKFDQMNKDFETLEKNRLLCMRYFIRQYITTIMSNTAESDNTLQKFEEKMATFIHSLEYNIPKNRVSSVASVDSDVSFILSSGPPAEKLAALNRVVSRVFVDMNSLDFFAQRLMKILVRLFAKAKDKLPSFIDAIKVESVKVKDTVPVFKSLKNVKMKSPDEHFIPDDITFQADVSYNGEFPLNVSLRCILFYRIIPSPLSIPHAPLIYPCNV
jgi:hypothetical protein